MRILVTGATGYLGLNLTAGLLAAGHEVAALVRPTSDLSRLAALRCDRLLVEPSDGSLAGVAGVFERHRPRAVIHLASLVLANPAHTDITPLVEANITLGLHLLEGAAAVETSYFLNTGTFWEHYRDQPYNPVNLYAATKRAFQDLLAYYAEATPLKALTLVLHDTYGPADFRPKLFSLLRRAAAAKTALDMTPGEQVVDLIYVDDVVSAYLTALDALAKGTFGSPCPRYAVTGGQPLPLREIVELYGEVTGTPVPVNWGARAYRPREMMRPWAGEPLPGWRPRVGLREGIARMEGLS